MEGLGISQKLTKILLIQFHGSFYRLEQKLARESHSDLQGPGN